jgi:hypothetical protein
MAARERVQEKSGTWAGPGGLRRRPAKQTACALTEHGEGGLLRGRRFLGAFFVEYVLGPRCVREGRVEDAKRGCDSGHCAQPCRRPCNQAWCLPPRGLCAGCPRRWAGRVGRGVRSPMPGWPRKRKGRGELDSSLLVSKQTQWVIRPAHSRNEAAARSRRRRALAQHRASCGREPLRAHRCAAKRAMRERNQTRSHRQRSRAPRAAHGLAGGRHDVLGAGGALLVERPDHGAGPALGARVLRVLGHVGQRLHVAAPRLWRHLEAERDGGVGVVGPVGAEALLRVEARAGQVAGVWGGGRAAKGGVRERSRARSGPASRTVGERSSCPPLARPQRRPVKGCPLA